MVPNYSSSINAWPTKNLFVGGGPSRPLNRISITVTKKSDFYKLDRVGPTVKAAKKLPQDHSYDRVLTAPKQGKITRMLNYLLEEPKGITPITPKKKRRTMYDPKVTESQL